MNHKNCALCPVPCPCPHNAASNALGCDLQLRETVPKVRIQGLMVFFKSGDGRISLPNHAVQHHFIIAIALCQVRGVLQYVL